MKRRAFIAGAAVAPVPLMAGAAEAVPADLDDNPPIERLRAAMAEIRDILQQAAPDGASLEGIVWGGPLSAGMIGAWASKDGKQYKFYDQAGKAEINFG
ncbi:hypothetical protein [uncultured Ruegeria sp.]|uniref:hypothetical protein n=1 Tax=uncultured Ruegeria sp. TaxID=259304 RepID=UPI0026080FFB|nr:hypothetical protein [uncultured Ruegeria sp.]